MQLNVSPLVVDNATSKSVADDAQCRCIRVRRADFAQRDVDRELAVIDAIGAVRRVLDAKGRAADDTDRQLRKIDRRARRIDRALRDIGNRLEIGLAVVGLEFDQITDTARRVDRNAFGIGIGLRVRPLVGRHVVCANRRRLTLLLDATRRDEHANRTASRR